MDAQTEQLWQQAAALRIDATGQWLDASTEALDLLGVPSVEALRALPSDAFRPEPADPAEQAAFQEAYATSLAQGLLIEGPFKRLDGELVRARAPCSSMAPATTASCSTRWSRMVTLDGDSPEAAGSRARSRSCA